MSQWKIQVQKPNSLNPLQMPLRPFCLGQSLICLELRPPREQHDQSQHQCHWPFWPLRRVSPIRWQKQTKQRKDSIWKVEGRTGHWEVTADLWQAFTWTELPLYCPVHVVCRSSSWLDIDSLWSLIAHMDVRLFIYIHKHNHRAAGIVTNCAVMYNNV